MVVNRSIPEYLEKGHSYTLHTDKIYRTFEILQETGASLYKKGGSALCYDAAYTEDGVQHYGKLKRFRASAALVGIMTIEEEAASYIRAYRRIQELVSQDKSMSRLYAFMPEFEIYTDEDGCPYIWTNDVPMKTFGEVCQKIWLSTGSVEDALYEIVTTIKSLTDCIRIMHSNRLIHGDINPSNIGFYMRDDKVLADGISLFDLDTVHSVGEMPRGYTSPYYSASAVEENTRTYCDIRAIGVTLCKALQLDDYSVERIIQCNNLFEKRVRNWKTIEDIVFTSPFFRMKGEPQDKDVKDQLLRIIVRTVTANRNRRIETCSTLYQELQLLETYLLPHITRTELGRGIGVEIVNREERRKGKLRSLFQYHLYEKPLYQYFSASGILCIFGFGSDAQQFLDVCLETIQSMNENTPPNEIRIIVWDDTAGLEARKRTYLDERPALKVFFKVDTGSGLERHRRYGWIEFKGLDSGNLESGINGALDGLSDADLAAVRYIYIAMGNDTQNRTIASVCAERQKDAVIDVQIENGTSRDHGRIHYLCVGADMPHNAQTDELERMAFNIHLLWTGSLNANLEAKREEFNKAYNHSASISAVLAIMYRLHYLGIDITGGAYQAARVFDSILRERDLSVMMKMVSLEHRRWVTEKICDGWTSLSVPDSLAFNNTKDTAHKHHTCIVRSGPSMDLQSESWTNLSMWDTATEEDLQDLDELDRMSVELHQAYGKLKDQILEEDLLDHRMAERIGRDISHDRKIMTLFLEWYSVLVDLFKTMKNVDSMIEERRVILDRYEGAYGRLVKALNSEEWRNNPRQKLILKNLSTMYVRFQPITLYLKFHDYKKHDQDQVIRIPFILTYTEHTEMAVMAPFELLASDYWDQTNAIQPDHTEAMQSDHTDVTQLFDCVAAATVVNPETLYIIYQQPEHAQPAQCTLINKKRDAFTAYCKRKGLQTKVVLRPCNDYSNAVADIAQQTTRNGRWLLVESNLGVIPEGYDHAGSFTFDPLTIQFVDTTYNISWVKYIPNKPHISAADVAAIIGRSAETDSQPFMMSEDYDWLYNLYKRYRRGWKDLCTKIKELNENQGLVGDQEKVWEKVVQLTNGRQIRKGEGPRLYILPYECYSAVKEIIDLFKKRGITGVSSHVERYSLDECRVVVHRYKGEWLELDNLFRRRDLLLSTNQFDIQSEPTTRTDWLVCDSLTVRNINLTGCMSSAEILKQLYNRGFILCNKHFEKKPKASEAEEKIALYDITFGSRQIKDLLSIEGRILEYYIYYRARNHARYHDVITSFVIKRPNFEDEAEFDCFITKGMQTVLIECKAREFHDNPEAAKTIQSFVQKLKRELKRYGINGKGLLVIDTLVFPKGVICPPNIKIIWKPEDIDNVVDIIDELFDRA